MNPTGIARSHTNIALIKYWGKRDKELFLPMNSSLSLTLDAFYTDTKVTIDETLPSDEFYLNTIRQSAEETAKISRFVDLFRQDVGDQRSVRVESLNFVPTAAGLASSASAFSALAGALQQVYQLEMSPQVLSTYARRGSGSATRSLFGGFVEWQRGTSNDDSIAVPIDDANWDIAMLIIIVSRTEKKISSRVGMDATMATSPFYPAWVESAAADIAEMKAAIAARDFIRVGELAEYNAMKMHATTLSARPPFTYFEPDSLRAQQHVRTLREELGIPAYFTMDAGPNVKVLCRASDLEKVRAYMETAFAPDQLITSLPGEGMHPLTEAEWTESVQHFTKGDTRS